MKNLKLMPKIFLYTLFSMLLVVGLSQGLIYLLAPRLQFALSNQADLVFSFNNYRLVAGAIGRAMPFSLSFSLLLSFGCSLFFSQALARRLGQISAATEQMRRLEKAAACPVGAQDEIGALAQNVNVLYGNLLATIEHLEQEKAAVQELEQARMDFLRAASHELKTPLTALGLTLENMLLGVGKYQEHAVYLPLCQEQVKRLSNMLQEILAATRLNPAAEPVQTLNLAQLLAEICQPYQLIAAAHQVQFRLELPEQCPVCLAGGLFRKAASNIIANAVAYTAAGRSVSVRLEARRLVVQNECPPLPPEALRRCFEPFWRPDFARSRQQGGNGLGLYIVANALQALGLTYTFEPMAAGDGMQFIINF